MFKRLLFTLPLTFVLLGACSDDGEAGEKCIGAATSCSSVGASDCSDQSGCYYTIGSNVSSTSDDGCAGSARECDDISNADTCKKQRGCSWR